MTSVKSLVLWLYFFALCVGESTSFSRCASKRVMLRRIRPSTTRTFAAPDLQQQRRRQVLQTAGSSLFNLVGVSVLLQSYTAAAAATSSSSLAELMSQLRQARKQLDAVPKLIDDKKWDSVRAILIQPPLSDCWTKSSRSKPLLLEYAEAIGESPKGDELAALEAKEELLDHLRYLDMAVYNNVFNPINSEGETGATKELIRSYYEDPIREYKASVAALEQLINLGKESL